MRIVIPRFRASWLSLLISILLIAACVPCRAQWVFLGPDGGDARSLAMSPENPNRIFLGTSSGALFRSDDGGQTWIFNSQFGSDAEYALERIAIDPRNSQVMYVGMWSIDDKNRGAFFKSSDGGKSWQSIAAMQDKSIRALAIAPSNPDVVVVGALQGIFRSLDAGQHWEKISEEMPIKNVESLVISPVDPNVVLAGTWHLGWKTLDGGRNWSAISKGIDNDSDIFSIIVDPQHPSIVYASACSGIYKSEDFAETFHKLTGVPFSARRTHVLRQVPGSAGEIYAGTTLGLWRSVDAGATWKRVTSSSTVVNDLVVDWQNPSHVILASDRMGLLTSFDSGRSFSPTNHGFSHRQFQTLVAEPKTNTLYAGSINDQEFGGVFRSNSAGIEWEQISAGLGKRDIYSLQRSSTGTLIAGTSDGVFLFSSGTRVWRPASVPQQSPRTSRSRLVENSRQDAGIGKVFQIRTILSRGQEVWIAATSEGVFSSSDEGRHWVGGPILTNKGFTSIDCQQDVVVIGNARNAFISPDLGQTWRQLSLPAGIASLSNILLSPDRTLWVTTNLGAFHSKDDGTSWSSVTAGNDHSMLSYINIISQNDLLALGAHHEKVFESHDAGATWRLLAESERPLRQLVVSANQLFGIMEFGGIVAGTLSGQQERAGSTQSVMAQSASSNK